MICHHFLVPTRCALCSGHRDAIPHRGKVDLGTGRPIPGSNRSREIDHGSAMSVTLSGDWFTPGKGEVSGLTFWPILLKRPGLDVHIEHLPDAMRPAWLVRRRIGAPWATAYFEPESGVRVYPDEADHRDQAEAVLSQ